MKAVCLIVLITACFFSSIGSIRAQDTSQSCKVMSNMLSQEYNGECKKGLAHGKGEAKGIHRYNGNFKDGLPNGNGIYYFSNDIFYTGSFQDGLKEGKGEMHYLKKDLSDSIIKGYWSGDEYRGKRYITYNTDAVSKFDRVEISPSSQSGNRISIEVSTTSSNPEGQLYWANGPLVLTELVCIKNISLIKLLSTSGSQLKTIWVFEITQFPITLRGVLSNGQTFNLELYKSANWTFRIFLNK